MRNIILAASIVLGSTSAFAQAPPLTCSGYIAAAQSQDHSALAPYATRLLKLAQQVYTSGQSTTEQMNKIAYDFGAECMAHSTSFDTAARTVLTKNKQPLNTQKPEPQPNYRVSDCMRLAQQSTMGRRLSMNCGWGCSQQQNSIYSMCMGY